MHAGAPDRTRVTLSTGHEIRLPLELEFTLGGVTLPARRSRLEALLPDELTSLAIAPGIGCVTLVGIQYHHVGGGSDERAGSDTHERSGEATADTGLEVYNEFGIIVPAVRGSRTSLPFAQLIDGELGGYIHWLPVTTDASVALGREIWGYPKERAEITVTDGPRGVRTVVGGIDDATTTEAVRLEVPRPRTRDSSHREWTLWSYTTMNDVLLRTRAEIRGRVAVGTPLGVTLEIDPALRAAIGCWNRPLARLYGSRVRARLHDGESMDQS